VDIWCTYDSTRHIDIIKRELINGNVDLLKGGL
jgi:hypothetical protein